MKYYNPNYEQYLQQYGFGSFLRKNAGVIGTIAGAGLGMLAGPAGSLAGASLGASLGGSVGGAVSADYQQDQQEDQMQEQLAQQQQQNKINIAQNRLSGLQQNQNLGGLNRFGLGGGLSSPNAESLFMFHATDPSTGRRAIPRDLTSTSQDLVKKLPMFESGMFNPIYANDMHNFYGKRDDGSVGYINTTKQFTGNDRSRYADHLDALRSREKYMENYQLPNPNKPSLPSKLDVKALGGMLTKYTGQDHATGAQGGIKVSENGNPTAITGEKPTALVEDGEFGFLDPETKQTYIFSKKIPYTK